MPNDSEASTDLGEKYLRCLGDGRRRIRSFAIAQDDKVIAQDDKIIVQDDKVIAISSATTATVKPYSSNTIAIGNRTNLLDKTGNYGLSRPS